MRVATFNIRHGRGRDDVVNLERTAAVIRETGAEVVALQELDRNHERSGRADQPSKLTELTGMHVHFDATLGRGRGEYGIALAGPSALAVRFEALPRAGDEEARGIQITRWRGATLIATHLSTVRAARDIQLDALADLVGGLDPPVVVMGDLNERSSRLGVLEAAGLRAGPRRRGRARDRWRSRLDHVLAGRGAVVVDSRVVASRASDHPAVVAEVAPGSP